jgi:hypothetical protein
VSVIPRVVKRFDDDNEVRVAKVKPSKMFAEAKRSLTNSSMPSKMIVEATGAYDQFD